MSKVIRQDIKIEDMIYEIRGKQVMLDSDLAKLYQCKNGTKSINLAVKRHTNRFPERFMFQLTEDEYEYLRFQFETTKNNNMSRTLPYAFTEQGVAMLATVLRTEISEKISIEIMDAFVAMRHFIKSNLVNQKYINDIVLENRKSIREVKNDVKLLQEAFDKLEEKEINNKIYFNGQIYDAYSKIQEIFKEANEKLVIIDSYADSTVLDIVKRLNVEVTIITKENNLLTKQDIEKYKKQYNNLKVIFNNTFHDRYFIIDKSDVYHCGASINRIGYKIFSINKIEDQLIKETLINNIVK